MLEVKDVQFSYDSKIIKSVSFQLAKGEVIGIVGRSGEGKTTLLKMIAGLLDAELGEIIFNDEKIVGPNYKLIPGYEDIQLVNQDFGLDIYHTTEENIREKALHLPKEERDFLVAELLELVELTHLKNQKALLLSGGEQQRLCIARALVCEPQLLLLDEPFVHIDARLRNKIVNYLIQLKKKQGLSILLVSHDGEEVLSFADRIIHFEKGKLKRIDTPYSFYYRPHSKKEAELFGAINKIKLNNEQILFRPNEFDLKGETNKLKVKFVRSQFFGAFIVNYFITEKKEKIQLFDLKELKDVKEISIIKRCPSPYLA
jgi:iron(III) transport system ATP-binding protein